MTDYRKASLLAPDFAIARANTALALYQLGTIDEAVREMRNIIRKYPRFADVRAAYTAALWGQGKRDEAESNWVSVLDLDVRYKDITWVKTVRRWPQDITKALEKFLTLS